MANNPSKRKHFNREGIQPRSFLLVGVLLAFIIAGTAGFFVRGYVDSESSPTKLMVQAARLGEIKKDGDKTQLILTDVDDNTTYFTDRPNHKAGSYPTSEYVNGVLPRNSSEGPPNAALVWSEDGEDLALTVELDSGKYNENTGQLIYDVNLVDDAPSELSDLGTKPEIPKGKIGPVYLFIDDSTLGSLFGGSVTAACAVSIDNETDSAFELYYNMKSNSTLDRNSAVKTIPGNRISNWYYTDDVSSNDECKGLMRYNKASDNTSGMYYLYDADIGRFSVNSENSFTVGCSPDLACFYWTNTNAPSQLANSLTICDAKNPNSSCKWWMSGESTQLTKANGKWPPDIPDWAGCQLPGTKLKICTESTPIR